MTGRENRKVLKTLGTDSGFEFGVCPRNYLLLHSWCRWLGAGGPAIQGIALKYS